MTERDASLDGRMIDDLRAWRSLESVGRREQVLIGLDELDALLAAADERDALKRAACAEPKTTTPDGRSSWPLEVRKGDAVRVGSTAVVAPSDMTISVDPVEEPPKCAACGGYLFRGCADAHA